MQRRTKRANPWRVIVLAILVAAAIYVNQVIVPATPPLFIPTPTPTLPPESFITKAEELKAQGKYTLAIQAYNDAIKVDPRNPALYLSLSQLQIYSGKYQDAVTNAANVLLISPNNAQAFIYQAWGKAFLGEYLDAANAIDTAINIDPTNALAYAVKGIILAHQDFNGAAGLTTRDDAIEASRTAMAMAPDLLETHWARGYVLEITSNYTEALAEFLAAVTLNDKIAELHLALGRNYRFLLDTDKAIEEFNRANALDPANPMPDTLIARTYANVGEYAKAIQFAQQAVQDSPDDPAMYGNLGWLYYHNLAYENAIINFSLAIHGGATRDGVVVEGMPLDYGRPAEYYYTYALALAKLGYCNEALPLAQALITGVRNDEIAIFNAQEVINSCTLFAQSGAPTPLPLTTPTNTPQPTAEMTATPTP